MTFGIAIFLNEEILKYHAFSIEKQIRYRLCILTKNVTPNVKCLPANQSVWQYLWIYMIWSWKSYGNIMEFYCALGAGTLHIVWPSVLYGPIQLHMIMKNFICLFIAAFRVWQETFRKSKYVQKRVKSAACLLQRNQLHRILLAWRLITMETKTISPLLQRRNRKIIGRWVSNWNW